MAPITAAERPSLPAPSGPPSPGPKVHGPFLPTLPPVGSGVADETPATAGTADVAGGPDAPASPSDPSATPAPGRKWKKRKKSTARKATTAMVCLLVVAAVGGGAWLGYQRLAPADDSVPPVPAKENPDTMIGKAAHVVDATNDRAPDPDLVDQVLQQNGD